MEKDKEPNWVEAQHAADRTERNVRTARGLTEVVARQEAYKAQRVLRDAVDTFLGGKGRNSPADTIARMEKIQEIASSKMAVHMAWLEGNRAWERMGWVESLRRLTSLEGVTVHERGPIGGRPADDESLRVVLLLEE